MIKYRRLNRKELEELEREFIQYLSSNGIDAPKWEEIKRNSSQEVELHLDNFSNAVFQKSLENIKFLDCKTSEVFKLFYFAQKTAYLIAIKSSKIDLLKIQKLEKHHLDSIEVFTATKQYTNRSREQEIFELTEQGCAISNGELFKQFAPVIGLKLESSVSNQN